MPKLHTTQRGIHLSPGFSLRELDQKPMRYEVLAIGKSNSFSVSTAQRFRDDVMMLAMLKCLSQPGPITDLQVSAQVFVIHK